MGTTRRPPLHGVSCLRHHGTGVRLRGGREDPAVKTTNELAFVGDVHGNLRALSGIWRALRQHDVEHVVFLGDYINKGRDSAAVLAELGVFLASGRVTLLAGNHEVSLLEA